MAQNGPDARKRKTSVINAGFSILSVVGLSDPFSSCFKKLGNILFQFLSKVEIKLRGH